MNDLALLVLHTATGTFFTITGYRKCCIAEVREHVLPFVAKHAGGSTKAAYAVIAGEFAGGLGLLTGTLTQLAAIGLLIIMLGAYLTDTVPEVVKKNDGNNQRTKLLSNLLCTPEWQLIIILIAIAMMGGGAYSLDALIQ